MHTHTHAHTRTLTHRQFGCSLIEVHFTAKFPRKSFHTFPAAESLIDLALLTEALKSICLH